MQNKTLTISTATAVELFPGRERTDPVLESLIIENNEGAASRNFIKIWIDRDTQPNAATHAAEATVYPCPIGDRQFAPQLTLKGRSWIAITQESGAAATAPADDVVVTVAWR